MSLRPITKPSPAYPTLEYNTPESLFNLIRFRDHRIGFGAHETTSRSAATAIYIQTERGHHIVTSGPYRFIRHLGYLAMAQYIPLRIVFCAR
jgi:protein-S-isoprenylcysteine O-methyltransferase Ste14